MRGNQVLIVDAAGDSGTRLSKTENFGRVSVVSGDDMSQATSAARTSIDAPFARTTIDARPARTTIDAPSAPAIARALRERDRALAAVFILSIAARDASVRMHWLDTDHACGWIASPAMNATSDAATTDTAIDVAAIARRCEAALAQGFVAADALLLACSGNALPCLSWGPQPTTASRRTLHSDREIGLYAILDSAKKLRAAVDAGVTTVQLRIKRPFDADARWEAMLRREVAECMTATSDRSAELVLNDHWRLAAELGIGSVHLGQEDLLALGDATRAALAARGIRLGVSSHSVWELCRARSLDLRYIACGPVWPTTTKDMPWRPQGSDNLAWWCRNASAPVVAIGGILEPEQARVAARSGADGVCLVRALGDDPRAVVPAFRDALNRGREERSIVEAPTERWPHPTLPSPTA